MSPVHVSSRLYILDVVPLHAPDVSRTIEMPALANLHDLHCMIQDAFELDSNHLYAFFMTNKAWDTKGAFGPSDSDPERAKLATLGLEPGREFLYLFDFGDELRHRVTVREIGEAVKGVAYPRVSEWLGKAPAQYGEHYELDEDLEPLAQEVAAAVRAWDSRSADDAPPTLDAILREAELARRLCEATVARPKQLLAIEEDLDVAASLWLALVPFDLVDVGRVDEGLALLATVARVLPEDDLMGDRAMLLARAKRGDEARAELNALREKQGDDLRVLDRCADVLVALGDSAEAEALTRRVRDSANEEGEGLELWLSSTERLVTLLRERGAEDEAAALEEEMEEDPEVDNLALGTRVARALGPAFDAQFPPLPVMPVTRATPKIGRNDPCSCGSGKKFKKCCG